MRWRRITCRVYTCTSLAGKKYQMQNKNDDRGKYLSKLVCVYFFASSSIVYRTRRIKCYTCIFPLPRFSQRTRLSGSQIMLWYKIEEENTVEVPSNSPRLPCHRLPFCVAVVNLLSILSNAGSIGRRISIGVVFHILFAQNHG